jgi:hypothetical protein
VSTEAESQEPETVLKPVAVFLEAFGLAFILSIVFSVLACSVGLSFSGLDGIVTVPIAIFFSSIVTTIVAVCFKRPAKHFRWPMMWLLVLILTLLSVAGVSWAQTRQHLRILMEPASIPQSLRVHHGRSVLFSSFVHFTASASDITALIKSKELIEVPDWDSDSDAEIPKNFHERERRKTAWDWWQPASMPGAKFYHRHHEGVAQGWVEGWWVDDKTNEVFAYISG